MYRYNKIYKNVYNSDEINTKKNLELFQFNLSAAICVIAKQENLYIKEFIEYYKNLGIKKIIIYDNNDLKNENFEKILKNEIIDGFVKIIDFRGLISPQIKAYNECYEKNKYEFDWIAFFDVDEFLFLNNCSNIVRFLSSQKFKKCSSILINWRIYGDNNNIYYKPKLVQKRFTKSFIFSEKDKESIYFYAAAKSIVRGGLNISWAHFPHFLNNTNICRPDGTLVKEPLSSPQYSSAYIKHYTTKSTEEYLIKIFKGDVYYSDHLNLTNFLNLIKYYYFFFNKISKKKLLYLKHFLKINLKKFFE